MGRNFGHSETLKWVYVSCSAMSWLCNGWGYSPLPRGRGSGEGCCACLCWSWGGVDPPLPGLTWKPSDSLRGRACAGTGRLKWIKIPIGTFPLKKTGAFWSHAFRFLPLVDEAADSPDLLGSRHFQERASPCSHCGHWGLNSVTWAVFL